MSQGLLEFVWPKAGDSRKIVNGVKNKKCGKCGKWQELKNYPKDRNRIDNFYGYCRNCESARQKAKNAKKKKNTKAKK